MEDVYAIQSEIAKDDCRSTASETDVKGKEGDRTTLTTDLAAFDLYSRAKS